MDVVVEMSLPFKRRWQHKLFQCAIYWKFWKPCPFKCPVCGHGYRCYWDGSDVNQLINVCKRCYPEQKTIENCNPTPLNTNIEKEK